MQASWFVVADDLTGLQAIAAEFARLGASVRTGAGTVPSISELRLTEIFGFDTGTRVLSPDVAASQVKALALRAIEIETMRLFKQNDSGLQGHVAVELAALRAASRQRPILYCPACPSLRRVTRNGRQIQLDEFGRMRDGALSVDLVSLLAEAGLTAVHLGRGHVGTGHLRKVMATSGPDIVLTDAESDEDLELLARDSEEAGCRVYAGSVGLAAALARRAQVNRRVHAPILIVGGSLQRATVTQLEALRSRGDCVEVTIDVNLVLRSVSSESIRACGESVLAALRTGKHCVLRWTADGGDDASVRPREAGWGRAIQMIAAVLRSALSAGAVMAGIVVAGGATAAAILHDVLGVSRFRCLTWIFDGGALAIADDGVLSGLPVVTKAGAWGPPDALSIAIDRVAALQAAFAARDAITLPGRHID
jgi:uncharacterized protein YgbK (DUF1537 family)